MTPRTFAAFIFLSLIVAVPSCSDESDDDCPAGSESCACYGNGTCDEPLDCRSDRCVGG